MSAYQKLPFMRLCGFVEAYGDAGLQLRETKESQTWRHASIKETAKRLALLYHDYILNLLTSSLTSYAICERYYNQIIATVLINHS